MEFLIALMVLFLAAAILNPKNKRRKAPKRKRPAASRGNTTRKPAVKIDPADTLREYWKEVDRGNIAVSKWFTEEPTERQLKRLKEDGVSFKLSELSKGKASDLIGLGMPPEPSDEEILRFFKVPKSQAPNETIARYKVSELLSDPEKAKRWANRPATQIQKEYYRRFSIPIPKGLTATDASAMMTEHELTDDQEDEWMAYEDILDEFADKDFREDYDLKKPSVSAIRKAVEQLEKEGNKLADLSADDLIETLLDHNPDLEKS